MIPLRSTIRSTARRRFASSSSPSPSASQPIFALTASSPLRPRLIPSIIDPSADPTPRLARSLHASARQLKDKRWVNSAGDEAAAKKPSDPAEAKDADEQAAPAPEAETSKAAEERARQLVEKAQPAVAASSSSESSSSSSSSPSSSSSSGSSSGGGGSGSSSSPPSDSPPPKSTGREITKPSIPSTYPQVLALPLTTRPLFPGFYKAVTITSKPVMSAIRELLAHGQPYIGAFLLRDGAENSDVITDMSQVHEVGVFAQITSVIEKAAEKEGEKDTFTAVLYPHRRIRIDELIKTPPPPTEGEQVVPVEKLVEEVQAQETGDEAEVASFEVDPVPSPEDVKREVASDEALGKIGGGGEAEGKKEEKRHSPINFLYPLMPHVSLTNVSNVDVLPYKKDAQMIRALMSELISVFKDIAQLNPMFREQITSFTMSQSTSNVFDEPEKLADFAAAVSGADSPDLQAVIDTLSVEDRLQKALFVLKQELVNTQLQAKIAKDVDSKLQKRQREYYLMEQLRGIKRELGMESDGKDKLVERFKEKASKLAMPEGVRKVFDEEIGKLVGLEQVSSEFNVTRNYLDWLTQIPWGVHSSENFDITHARSVLDEDHYGLQDVKDRILEFLAVGKLRGTVQGKIICLSGPPGVGKTSIGKSIARALGRQFFRFSVGGMHDVAEIKGHRRTYIGAMPGKPIQALKKVGTENPLILIDEIDKIASGRNYHGDPSSALLEMLDPEQNSSFLDHYMDVPVDLSRVLFVCTANVLDTIPAPLLDRMEVLEVSGYVSQEKLNIADKYLSPQAKEASGLKDVDVVLEQDAIEALIRSYARESGVRNLKKHIEKIYRKAAFKIVSDLGESALPEPEAPAQSDARTSEVDTQQPDSKPASEAVPSDATSETTKVDADTTTVTTEVRQPIRVPAGVHMRITSDNLKDYVGPPKYQKDRLYVAQPPAGVSTGLGYLGNGSGAVMPIEVTSMPGKGNLQLTGKLGEVIRESAQIALSWVKAHAFELGVTKSEADMMLNDRDIHLHMPEGAIGKEGPSAGTAILTAFVSLFTKTKINPDVAMTGEISLGGQVLPVGGLKEKILAAHRAGIRKLIVPVGCKSDIDENVPDSVKSGIEFVFVDEVRQVLHEVFEGSEAERRWRDVLPVENEPQREIAA